MTKFKRLAASIMAAATLATTAMGGISASASTEDKNFTNFTAPPSIAGTYNPIPVNQHGIRVKDTYSSVYVKITSSTYKVSTQTWGLADTQWSGGANKTCKYNGSNTTAVTLSSGHHYEIKNKIRESGYACAGLKMCSTNQYNSSTVTGKWSPDYSYDPTVDPAN